MAQWLAKDLGSSPCSTTNILFDLGQGTYPFFASVCHGDNSNALLHTGVVRCSGTTVMGDVSISNIELYWLSNLGHSPAPVKPLTKLPFIPRSEGFNPPKSSPDVEEHSWDQARVYLNALWINDNIPVISQGCRNVTGST